jgi:hypothetical protein
MFVPAIGSVLIAFFANVGFSEAVKLYIAAVKNNAAMPKSTFFMLDFYLWL